VRACWDACSPSALAWGTVVPAWGPLPREGSPCCPGYVGQQQLSGKADVVSWAGFPPVPIRTCAPLGRDTKTAYGRDGGRGTTTVPLGAMALEGLQPTLPQPRLADPDPACWGEGGTVQSRAHSRGVRLARSPLAGH